MIIGQRLRIMSSLRLESRPALLRLAIVLVLELDVEQLTPSSKSRSGRTRVQRARYRYKPQGWHRMLHVFFFAVGDEAGVEAEADTSADVNGAVANAKVAEPGFDPGTFGIWAQHADHCATPLMFSLF